MKTMNCQQCSGVMRQRTRSTGNASGIALALIVFAVGLVMTFIPIACFIGPFICIAALFMGGKREGVWQCDECGYYWCWPPRVFARAESSSKPALGRAAAVAALIAVVVIVPEALKRTIDKQAGASEAETVASVEVAAPEPKPSPRERFIGDDPGFPARMQKGIEDGARLGYWRDLYYNAGAPSMVVTDEFLVLGRKTQDDLLCGVYIFWVVDQPGFWTSEDAPPPKMRVLDEAGDVTAEYDPVNGVRWR